LADELIAVWRALADPTRRRLLDLLKDGPRTTGDLCERFPVSRFAIMKHLAMLERAGLVIVERRGRERWNHLNAVPIQQIYERWISGYQAFWASSLLRLKARIEESSQVPSQRRRRARHAGG
jgi:DNA-binding transcriptional ArsR family regulator